MSSRGVILVIIVVVLLIGILPIYPYSAHWGPYPSGLGVVLLAIVLVLLFTGRI